MHFDLPEPDMGISGESLWAAPLGNDFYQLQNSPWHARTVNWLDVVEAHAKEANQWPEFERVHRRSGHRTIHLYILDLGQDRQEEILQRCNQLGATYESKDKRLYALDVAPDIDVTSIIEYVTSLQQQDLADCRVNESD